MTKLNWKRCREKKRTWTRKSELFRQRMSASCVRVLFHLSRSLRAIRFITSAARRSATSSRLLSQQKQKAVRRNLKLRPPSHKCSSKRRNNEHHNECNPHVQHESGQRSYACHGRDRRLGPRHDYNHRQTRRSVLRYESEERRSRLRR